ncbi:phage portal protein [Desulfoscipio geothermicus]|uniref:Phage portal protein, HK97 family n=1 Tax=Desulfoscipio geothermicus DSM 3669 TaxID=1121426 RepID=A0A1I6ECQ8_9FIRM|nr:phage portal protein [Desulfoscipio geothermicus]SFR15278.1 phage portal protein, HK97 family [Desulfoscipio geothermicus DSM 3669]
MAEKRSLFQMIFGWVKNKAGFTRLQMLNGYSPTFSPWGGDPYEADVVRSAVDAIARNAAKLKAKHIRRVGNEIIPVGGQIERILQIRPNPNMSAYDFLYKLITTLMIDNNAFAYPVWDGMTLKAIWPVNCSLAEFMEDQSGTIYVKFYFGAGHQVILPYSEVFHLRRHFYKSDMAGEDNEALDTTLEAIHTSNEGIAQAIKTSANLRGLIKYQGMLKESDIKANRDRFVQEYMTMNNSGGVAALDAKAEYQELKNDPKIVNASQMKELRDIVYRYFGVNENIVMGKYTEDEWDAFYESTLEPLAIQMSLEFTSKLFTARELGHGNEIIFEANRLQYASTKTKVQMAEKMIPMGLLTINEAREIFNLAPVEGGDRRIVSLNYVNADKADLYQIGEGDDDGGKSQEGN